MKCGNWTVKGRGHIMRKRKKLHGLDLEIGQDRQWIKTNEAGSEGMFVRVSHAEYSLTSFIERVREVDHSAGR